MPTKKEHVQHEIYMHRLLSEILDEKELATSVFFKGGTCARMRGFLDRFSVDLDFDLSPKADKKRCREKLYNIFNHLDLEVKDESENALQFFLKYPAAPQMRNTVKLEMLDKVFEANKYEPGYLSSIDRTAMCQTLDTMFAHKLVAPIDRHEQGQGIAGRDIYDIHHFFSKGYEYNKEVIEERRGVSARVYFQDLKGFIDKEVTMKILEEDLNVLLEYDKFIKIKKFLKEEVLRFIDMEIESLANN